MEGSSVLLIFTSLIHLVHLLLKSYCQSCPKPVVKQLVFNFSKYKSEFLLFGCGVCWFFVCLRALFVVIVTFLGILSMTMATSYKEKKNIKTNFYYRRVKASPPERSLIVCLLRSATFLPVPKAPVAHRLEMVTLPRRFLSPQEETFCRGEDVTGLILQDSCYPIYKKTLLDW